MHRTYIVVRWLFHCNTGKKAKNIYFLDIRDHTIMNNRSVGKNNKIHKHWINFKFPPFCVDVINVWSLIGNNFLKKVMERWETSKVKSFILFCNMFF